MIYKETVNFIFKRCSKRIAGRIKEKKKNGDKLFYKNIYPNDPKLISRIVNNRRTKNNPYLLTSTVLEHGIIPALEFESCSEVLWGTKKEIEGYLFELFSCIVVDLLFNEKEPDIDVNDILCKYVPYAKYATFYWIILENQYEPMIYYGIREDDIIDNMDIGKPDSAIYKSAFLLFDNFKDTFKKSYLEFIQKFTKKEQGFKSIDKCLAKCFIEPLVIPLLKENIPPEDCFGLRVKHLISADLSSAPELIENAKSNNTTEFDDIRKRLNHASSNYILELEKIQEQLLALNNLK